MPGKLMVFIAPNIVRQELSLESVQRRSRTQSRGDGGLLTDIRAIRYLPRMKSKAGFTLIELIVVIAVVGILSGIAVPSFLRLRSDINERAAQATIAAIHAMQLLFFIADEDGDGVADYASSLDELLAAGHLAGGLESGELDGYRFTVTSRDPLNGYTLRAEPVEPCLTGDTVFVDEVGPDGQTRTASDAEGQFCSHDFLRKAAQHTVTRVENLARLESEPAVEALLKGNPEFMALAIKSMDSNQDEKLEIEEVLGADLLELARRMKAGLKYPKELDSIESGDDKKLDKVLDQYLGKLRKDLKLGAGNEKPLPPLELGK